MQQQQQFGVWARLMDITAVATPLLLARQVLPSVWWLRQCLDGHGAETAHQQRCGQQASACEADAALQLWQPATLCAASSRHIFSNALNMH
jgi:hypothetical protein